MTARGLFVGLTTLDLVHRVDAHVAADEKASALRQDVDAGGPAANAAATFAALGGAARLVTALGMHPLLAAASADLRDRGVEVVDVMPERLEPLPVSAVRVLDSTGERSVTSVNDIGLEAAPPGDLDLAGFDIVVLDGWHRRLALHVASIGGVPIVLGAGSWRPLVAQLLPMADYAIASANIPAERLAETASWARTSGADPVRWHTSDEDGAVPVPNVAVRDTLGAGDVFLGATAFALAAGRASWPGAIGFAVSIASIRVQHIGMRAGLAAVAASTELRGPAR